MQWFRGGLVFKAHRLVYHSTLGLRVIKKKKVGECLESAGAEKVARFRDQLLLGAKAGLLIRT